MKAFSKAALGQADKLDPREQAKAEAREWVNAAVDTLNTQAGPAHDGRTAGGEGREARCRCNDAAHTAAPPSPPPQLARRVGGPCEAAAGRQPSSVAGRLLWGADRDLRV
jgi:hypothetical protein